MEEYLSNFKNCLEKEDPYCKAVCPFHYDILNFIDKTKKGSFSAAYKIYRDAVGFPQIASVLCDEPCSAACTRCKVDSPVQINLLEKSCLALAAKLDPPDYNVPVKNKKIGIIGAGICGLACTLRLATKKYEVALYEKNDRVGGHLLKLHSDSLLNEDIQRQFKYAKYQMNLNSEIKNLEELQDEKFDAILIATGKDGQDFGLLAQEPPVLRLGDTVIFAAGSILGKSGIQALADGLEMANVIEGYLKTKAIGLLKKKDKTKMLMDTSEIGYTEPVKPNKGMLFSEEEAIGEASRCISCSCNFCSKCDLISFSKKLPLRIMDEVMATTLPGKTYIKATPAKRLINTGNLSGLCKEVCPESIDLDQLILEGRRSMHRQGKMPAVFHEFWLRDMDFSNSPLAAVAKTSNLEGKNMTEDHEKCTYAFFPGCQLGASDPELVEKTYEYLLDHRSDTGLLLRCCGVPAEWAGDEEKHKAEIEENKNLWEKLGKPILIMACPTCEKKFKTYLPDIPVVSLYEIMKSWGISRKSIGGTWSVFDPCAARSEENMKKAVRKLAQDAGLDLKPLPENESYYRCCGYGGQPDLANPEYTEYVTKKRIAESDYPYITYCINCRDLFINAGKEAVHILDLLFKGGIFPRKLATVSERRENRIQLKKQLLGKFWKESMPEVKKHDRIELKISSELSGKLNRARILEEDIIDVIQYCQRTGRKVCNPDNASFSGYHQSGSITYWIEFRESSKGVYEIVNAYSHKMRIELESVWNGRKVDYDL